MEACPDTEWRQLKRNLCYTQFAMNGNIQNQIPAPVDIESFTIVYDEINFLNRADAFAKFLTSTDSTQHSGTRESRQKGVAEEQLFAGSIVDMAYWRSNFDQTYTQLFNKNAKEATKTRETLELTIFGHIDSVVKDMELKLKQELRTAGRLPDLSEREFCMWEAVKGNQEKYLYSSYPYGNCTSPHHVVKHALKDIETNRYGAWEHCSNATEAELTKIAYQVEFMIVKARDVVCNAKRGLFSRLRDTFLEDRLDKDESYDWNFKNNVCVTGSIQGIDLYCCC